MPDDLDCIEEEMHRRVCEAAARNDRRFTIVVDDGTEYQGRLAKEICRWSNVLVVELSCGTAYALLFNEYRVRQLPEPPPPLVVCPACGKSWYGTLFDHALMTRCCGTTQQALMIRARKAEAVERVQERVERTLRPTPTPSSGEKILR